MAVQHVKESDTSVRSPTQKRRRQPETGHSALKRLLGYRRPGTARLDEAITAYGAALEEETRCPGRLQKRCVLLAKRIGTAPSGRGGAREELPNLPMVGVISVKDPDTPDGVRRPASSDTLSARGQSSPFGLLCGCWRNSRCAAEETQEGGLKTNQRNVKAA
jgi:hypothetical protein